MKSIHSISLSTQQAIKMIYCCFINPKGNRRCYQKQNQQLSRNNLDSIPKQAGRKTYVTKWKHSQLARSEFCRREGLCLQTFCYWIEAHPTPPNKQSQPALSFFPVGTKHGMVDVNLGCASY